MRIEINFLWLAAFAVASTGCGSSSTGGDTNGNLSVLLEAEETITDGLRAGTGDEDILDGFDVTFSRYIATVGNVAMSQVSGGNAQGDSTVGVADFTTITTVLPELTSFDGIPTGQYTSFGFETPAASASMENINAV